MASNTQSTLPTRPANTAEPSVNRVPASLHRLFDRCNLTLNSHDAFVFLVNLVARSPGTIDASEREIYLNHMKATTKMLDYVLQQSPSAQQAAINSSVYGQYNQTLSCIASISLGEYLPASSLTKISSMARELEEVVLQNESSPEKALNRLCETREDFALTYQGSRTCIDDVREALQNRRG